MKKTITLLVLLASLAMHGQVEVFKGFVLDTLTAAELNALPDIVKLKGAYFHNRDNGSLVTWNGSAWVPVSGSSSDLQVVGNSLSLTNPVTPGNAIDLSPYLDNTDTQLSDPQVETAYNNQVPIASQAEAESGTSTNVRRFTPQRIKQAIDALAPSSGTTYTAGNGLNLNTNEFSVDSTRVLLVSGISPILGPWEFAAGTNAQLDALAAPVAPVKRFSFAIDGGVGYVSGSASGTGDMLKSTYDTGDNGIVDNSEALGGVGLSNFMRNNSPSNIATNHTLLATNQLNFNSSANYMKPTANGVGFYNSSAGATSYFYDGTETGQWNSTGLQMLNGFHIRTTNEVYGAGWNGSLQVPTKDAVYDRIESLGSPNLATVLSTGNSAGSSSINMNGQNITGANTISGTSANITTITSSTVSVNDAAYGAGWNGSLAVPTRNAVYDEIQSIRPTSGTGTTGITLIGTTSGSYSIGSQTWRWARSGDLVTFTIKLTNVSGTSPTGPLRLELSGTTIPGMAGTTNDYVFSSFIISAGAYYPDLHVRNFDADSLDFYTLEFSGTTAIPVSDADFASTTITITGSFIAS